MKRIKLSGTPQEIGMFHGRQMKAEIGHALEYYRPRFSASGDVLAQSIEHFIHRITAFNPDFKVEMDAIAKGADVEPFWIYALNSRSELMSSPAGSFYNECSMLGFPGTGLAGQNWDWAAAIHPLLAIAEIQPVNGPKIMTMIEPGLLGKIGMNEHGLGVLLNILPADTLLRGLPVHILLRALLECRSLEQAADLIKEQGEGKASHIMVVDKQMLKAAECAPKQAQWPEIDPDVYIHTNHYLCSGQAQPTLTRTCTETRLNSIRSLVSGRERSMSVIRQALDQDTGDYPVLRAYRDHPLTGAAGTLMTMLLDCGEKKLWFRHGHDNSAEFVEFTF